MAMAIVWLWYVLMHLANAALVGKPIKSQNRQYGFKRQDLYEIMKPRRRLVMSDDGHGNSMVKVLMIPCYGYGYGMAIVWLWHVLVV